MENIVLGAIGMIIAIGLLIYFKDSIQNMKFITKIGILAVIVALAGFMYTQFSLTGIIIYRMAIVVCIMSVVLNIYYYIFKEAPGTLVGIGFICIFLAMIFEAMILSKEIMSVFNAYEYYLYLGRNIMMICMLGCIVLKAYTILFKKSN